MSPRTAAFMSLVINCFWKISSRRISLLLSVMLWEGSGVTVYLRFLRVGQCPTIKIKCWRLPVMLFCVLCALHPISVFCFVPEFLSLYLYLILIFFFIHNICSRVYFFRSSFYFKMFSSFFSHKAQRRFSRTRFFGNSPKTQRSYDLCAAPTMLAIQYANLMETRYSQPSIYEKGVCGGL